MNCKKCGAPINETDAFCKNCGSLVGFETTPTESTTNNTVSPIPGAIDFSMPSKPEPIAEDKTATTASSNQSTAMFNPEQNAPISLQEINEVKKEEPKVETPTPVVQNNITEGQPSLEPISSNVEMNNTPTDSVFPIFPTTQEKTIENQESSVSDTIIIPRTDVSSNLENNNVKQEENVSSIPETFQPVEPQKKFSIEDAEPELEIDEVTKSKKGLIIIIAIVLVLLAVIGVLVFKYVSNKKKESEVDKPNISDIAKYRINFGGYRLEIPEDYIYQVAGSKLYISDSQNTWYVAIQLADMSYTEIDEKANQIASTYQKSGFKISNAEEKEISGRKYYAVELQTGTKYALATYSKADSNRVFALAAYNPTYTIDYAILENISSILDSAVYLGAPGSITQSSSIDVLGPIK